MTLALAIAYYDFTYPFCYISNRRVELIGKELDLRFEWREFEDYPTLPKKGRRISSFRRNAEGKLSPFSALEAWAAEIDLPISVPKVHSNSNLALRGSLFARKLGRFPEYKKAVYSAYWVEGKDIGKFEVLSDVASDVGLDRDDFERFVSSRHSQRVFGSERREAENLGIEFIPTFILGSERVIGKKSLSAFKECLESYVELVKEYPSNKNECSQSVCLVQNDRSP